MKKLLPIGLSDFKELIDTNRYYIDKTLLIHEIETSHDKVILIPSPRRFGKTLNLSTLRYFYEKAEISTSYLFEDTAIWDMKKYRALQRTSPVIFVSFKDCKKSSWSDAFEHFQIIIAREFHRHASSLWPFVSSAENQKYNAILNGTASQAVFEDSLHFLSDLLKRCYKSNVIILIDEYDTPIRAGFDNEFYNEVINFVRELLAAALKDNTSLHKGILTGIMRPVKEGIFLGSIIWVFTQCSIKGFLINLDLPPLRLIRF